MDSNIPEYVEQLITVLPALSQPYPFILDKMTKYLTLTKQYTTDTYGHIVDDLGRNIFIVGPYVIFQKDPNRLDYIRVKSSIYVDYTVSYYTSVDHITWNEIRDLVYF
jgi:hypothetical protein